MKNIYLENTSNNHDKFYHMIENKDGASFTATWGRTGSNGRTQIYSMSEWDKIYNSKINKGYKSQYHKNPSKDKNKIHYDVGQVDVEINHSHMNKLRILKMTLENWAYDNGKNFALDSKQGRMYEADLHKVNELMDKGKLLPITPQENFLTKDEMKELNFIFKYYGGIRKQGWTK